MAKKVITCVLVLLTIFYGGCLKVKADRITSIDGSEPDLSTRPLFLYNASVHDPSVIKVDDTYYIFGSHLAAAKSTDLMNWTQISRNALPGNRLIPNIREELNEALTWAKTNTLWAPDVIQLGDGKFYMYYCACEGSSPLSALGIAVAEQVEGPYQNLGIILRSGMNGIGEDGSRYNANIHPNAIDPHVFFDKEERLWMVYGSYSGGIFILELDPESGFPYPGQGYGKKLMGGNHARIEGPYILYSPDTDYYYLFVTFGGLAADGGYNMRIARSNNPEGPYYDAQGNLMLNARGRSGTFFHDPSIESYGVKLFGNYQFLHVDGEPRPISRGYVSPGHNSAYYDPDSGKYFLIFHTRFVNRGEQHEVRVHQMFINEDDWLVVTPHRYAGETKGYYSVNEIVGEYKYINHGLDITAEVKQSSLIRLNQDYTISGNVSGTWESDGSNLTLMIDGERYSGVLVRQWDDDNAAWLMAFTALSAKGVTVWGSKVNR
ncbi:MAG: glycoside hydrolase family 43 protein [Firmicutes bacterium]|nr:glycoside hydrolase family 43 protein [Bacillota bacterium]